jgi:hypothetical protein
MATPILFQKFKFKPTILEAKSRIVDSILNGRSQISQVKGFWIGARKATFNPKKKD